MENQKVKARYERYMKFYEKFLNGDVGNKYAVVTVVADGFNPGVYTFNIKEKARKFLKQHWKETLEIMREDYAEPDIVNTWCDDEGDYAKITFEADDWICFQVVNVKNKVG